MLREVAESARKIDSGRWIKIRRKSERDSWIKTELTAVFIFWKHFSLECEQ